MRSQVQESGQEFINHHTPLKSLTNLTNDVELQVRYLSVSNGIAWYDAS